MPQLDPNTFLSQYIGIIIVILVFYVLLSYAVLPVLLRAMLIRDRFLASSTVSVTSSTLLNKHSLHTIYVLTYVREATSSFFGRTLSICSTFLDNTHSTPSFAFKVTNTSNASILPLHPSFSSNYLVFYLVIDKND